RPTQRTSPDGLQQMHDGAALTEQLRDTTMSSGDRRRLLRERNRIRDSRAVNTLFHQYRHRPYVTYENFVNPKERQS
ncbi:hypothetical protein EC973_007387, partial [Apophysomyces ossiformis]